MEMVAVANNALRVRASSFCRVRVSSIVGARDDHWRSASAPPLEGRREQHAMASSESMAAACRESLNDVCSSDDGYSRRRKRTFSFVY